MTHAGHACSLETATGRSRMRGGRMQRKGIDMAGTDRHGAGTDRHGAGTDRHGAGTDRHGREQRALPGAVRRAVPWAFPVVYIGWAWLWWTPVLRSPESVWSGWNTGLFLIGAGSPLLAGLTLAGLTGGRDRVRDLGRRLVDVRRIPGRWWLFILLFWVGFDLVVAGAAVLVGVTSAPFDPAVDTLTDPGVLALSLLLWLLGPAAEEIGVRGYWLDRLFEHLGPSRAALVNGTVWALWHVPLVMLPGYHEATTFDPQLWWWLPAIVSQTVLYAWVYLHTDRSVLGVVVFHTMMNATGELLGLSNDVHAFSLVVVVPLAVAVMAGWRRTGHRRLAPS